MSSRWTGFLLWALVAASAVFWGVRVFSASRPVPAGAHPPQRMVAAATPMVRLFGAVAEPEVAEEAQPGASDRFQLLGVIASPDGRGAGALALVSVDNQPAKPWRVGSLIDGETALLAVTRRAAEFGPRGGPASFTLELPAPGEAATGTLPAAVSGQPGAPVRARPVVAGRPGFPGNGGAMPPGGVAGGPPPGQAFGMRGPNGLPVGNARPINGPNAGQAPEPGVVQNNEE